MSSCTKIKGCNSLSSDDTDVCMKIFNKTEEDVTFSFLPGKSGACYDPFIVKSKSTNEVSLPYPSIWGVKGSSGRQYNPMSVTAQGSNYYVVSLVTVRPSVVNKKYPFIVIVPVLVIVIIIGFVFMALVSKASIVNQCAEKQLDDAECSTQVEIGSIKTAHKGIFIFFIVVLFILLSAVVVGWVFTYGPAKFSVSFSQCATRGENWKWVDPRSTFHKIICQIFGGCECASDTLENDCIAQEARLDKNYSWESSKAALATNGNTDCFCCNSDGCITVDGEMPSACQQNKK